MPGDEAARRRIARMARAGAWLVRVLGRTWRIRVTNDDAVRRLRAAKQPIVFSLWHGQILPLLYHHRGEGVVVMISEHADGELVAQVAERLGFATVRGSTSRGAARALLQAVSVVRDGHDLAVTPDGPRGPAKSIAPGIAVLAQRTGAPVIGAAAHASAAWRLKSWDAFVIPRPFSRVHVAYSDAITVGGSVRDAAGDTGRIEQLMASAEARAGA
jgi:lysophospholipid acyltransferase (LPLAT)-like uncharacterized protein